MSGDQQVHCSNRFADTIKMRSNVAVVESGMRIESANFKRGHQLHQRLPISPRITAL